MEPNQWGAIKLSKIKEWLLIWEKSVYVNSTYKMQTKCRGKADV